MPNVGFAAAKHDGTCSVTNTVTAKTVLCCWNLEAKHDDRGGRASDDVNCSLLFKTLLILHKDGPTQLAPSRRASHSEPEARRHSYAQSPHRFPPVRRAAHFFFFAFALAFVAMTPIMRASLSAVRKSSLILHVSFFFARTSKTRSAFHVVPTSLQTHRGGTVGMRMRRKKRYDPTRHANTKRPAARTNSKCTACKEPRARCGTYVGKPFNLQLRNEASSSAVHVATDAGSDVNALPLKYTSRSFVRAPTSSGSDLI